MSALLQITTGSRLHFGPLAVGEVPGRLFGGLGLMLEQPGIRMLARAADTDSCTGPEEAAPCVARALAAVRNAVPALAATGLAVELRQIIPRHYGLGSGTQLALATAQAASGETVVPATQLARWTGRGLRSAIGIHGHQQGGFLVDAGKRSPEAIGTLALRMAFPEDWPILLWLPRGAPGLSGEDERRAFARLPAMPSNTTDRLCAVILRELVPALVERHHPSFSRALQTYGALVGEYFSTVQGEGGIWSDPRGRDVARWLQTQGIEGIAQSSWGPTIAAVLPDAATAARLLQTWPFDPETLRLTRARNRGADVTVVATDPTSHGEPG